MNSDNKASSQEATKEHFISMLGDFRHAMLVTHTSDGELHSRPMALAEVDDDGDVWLMTPVDSPKVAELSEDARVSVSLQTGSKFAAISGSAEVLRDREHVERLWSESWRTWFPKGPNDGIALIKVVPHNGEYWDNEGVNGIKYMYKAAKAYLKGERPRMDSDLHGRVSIQH